MSSKTTISLEADEARRFSDLQAERRSIMQTSELITRQLQERLQNNNVELEQHFRQLAAKYGIDLQSEEYGFDEAQQALTLRNKRFDVV